MIIQDGLSLNSQLAEVSSELNQHQVVLDHRDSRTLHNVMISFLTEPE